MTQPGSPDEHDSSHAKHHFILPNSMILALGACLLVLTAITVGVAHIDLGRMNFAIAMFVATIKASIVALFFMNLKYDSRENGVIFGTSFLFLAIFIVFVSTDLFFRGDVYVKGPLMATNAQAKSRFAKPWLPNPELVSHGKELFNQQCVTCHGIEGKGNGAAASALNPPPRNFTELTGWKNGRKLAMIFKTLKEGLPPSAMASYATLPAEDRWALAQYVITFNTTPAAADTPEDFAKIGVNPNGDASQAVEVDKSIPVDLALERMSEAGLEAPSEGEPGGMRTAPTSVGARIYQTSCLSCHGAQGQGAKVTNLGLAPRVFIVTPPLNGKLASMQSLGAFNSVVVHGIPGRLMPGNGQLSGAEISELFGYVKGLAAR